MKKSLLLAAALACSGAVAQEKEIWACQQTEGTALTWISSSWRQMNIISEPLLLTIDGENSSYKVGDYEQSLDCSKGILSNALTSGVTTSCLGSLTSLHIYLLTDTGKMGMSDLYGAISSSSVRRDTVSAKIYNCTKF